MPRPNSRICRFPSDVRHHVLLIVKEALNNALKHGQPTEVTLRIRLSEGWLELRVEDNGRGLEGNRIHGNGLSNMHERSDSLGGSFRIDDRPEGGTTLAVVLPLTGRRRHLKRTRNR